MTQHLDTPAIQTRTVLEVQWSDCPQDVYNEVRELWKSYGFGNDYYYYHYQEGNLDPNEYPKLCEYLSLNNIEDCLIHWWW